MSPDAQNGPGGNPDRSKTSPREEGSSDVNANTMALPRALELRIANLESQVAQLANGCPYACSAACSSVCTLAAMR